MTIEILSGSKRDYHVDRIGQCCRCGFMEPGLVCYDDGTITSVECAECLHQSFPERLPDLIAVFLPELSKQAFSHYLRMLGWTTFAARVDRINGHDFSGGTLPPAFVAGDGWEAPLRWHSVAQGLDDRYAGHVSRDGLQLARNAFSFVSLRLGKTEALHASCNASDVRRKVGTAAFDRDYRVMSSSIPTERIRTWGSTGSTFRLVAAKTK